jgi:TonB family protein
MKKNIGILTLLVVISNIIYAQKIDVIYFGNYQEDTHQYSSLVDSNKAKYKIIRYDNDDSTGTEVVTERTTNKLISKITTGMGQEPFGKWILLIDSSYIELDYNFEIVRNKFEDDFFYNPSICYSSIDTNYAFENDDEIIELILAQIQKNIYYKENPILYWQEGIVRVGFFLNSNGEAENINIVNSKYNEVMEKEAIRVVRKLKIDTEIIKKTKKRNFCFTIPFRFEHTE